jgi:hypothetical protein
MRRGFILGDMNFQLTKTYLILLVISSISSMFFIFQKCCNVSQNFKLFFVNILQNFATFCENVENVESFLEPMTNIFGLLLRRWWRLATGPTSPHKGHGGCCRMDLPGPTTSVGTRTDYSVGPWDYLTCVARYLMV